MQNTFSQSGNDSKWFLKNCFSEYRNRTWDHPPPLHGKIHLKFPFWLLEDLIKWVWKIYSSQRTSGWVRLRFAERMKLFTIFSKKNTPISSILEMIRGSRIKHILFPYSFPSLSTNWYTIDSAIYIDHTWMLHIKSISASSRELPFHYLRWIFIIFTFIK